MKRSLMRPTDMVFPLAGAAACLLGNVYSPMYIFFCYYLLQVFSLCSVDSFRNAAAREPGVRRVDRRFTGAILPVLLGAGVILLVLNHFSGETADLTEVIPGLAAAACIIIEQLFEERMHAIGKSVDVVLMSLVSGALLLAGMLLDGFWGEEMPLMHFFTLCGAGLSLLVAMTASFAAEPLRGFSLVPRNVPFCLKAAVQLLLYPATAAALLFVQLSRGEASVRALEGYLVFPLLAGLVFWRLSRTVCRRAADESRPLNLLLVSAAALAVIFRQVLELELFHFPEPELVFICAECLVLALICAVIVFCAPGWRLYAGTAMLAAACGMNIVLHEFFPYGEYAAVALCVIAVALNLHKAFLRKV